MTSKPLLSSEKAKKRVFSDDYQSLPDVQIEECHNTRQARRRASFGDVVDMIHSPRLPRARSYDSVVFNFRDVAAEDFANQLTLIDLRLFKAIPREELMRGGWDSRHRKTLTPNVNEFSRRFNNVSFWVVREVLGAETIKLRIPVLRHFIRIAKKLHDLNNMHSMMAVVTALDSAPIYRLIQTWQQLPNKDKRMFDKLQVFTSVEDNRQALRQHLEEITLPCIPYLGK
jgi:hypothetical protein